MSVRQYPEVPKRWVTSDEKGSNEHLFVVALAVRGLLVGQSNNLLEVTLTPDATTTTVSDARIGGTSKAFMTACSASASLATGLWVEASLGAFTIHHDSSSEVDREFCIAFHG